MRVRPRAPWSSLRVHLVLLVAIAVVPALALLLSTAAEQRRQAVADVQDNALAVAHRTAVNYEQLIGATQPLLIALTHLAAVRDGDAATCGPTLAEMLRYYPLYANLGVIAPNGDLVCSARPASALVNLSDRAYFQQAIARRSFVVGNYQVGRVTQQATLNVAYPIIGDTNEVTGVVFAALQLSGITQTLQANQLPPGASLTLLDERGIVLDRVPDPGPWVGQSIADTPFGATVLARREGAAAVPGLDNSTRLLGFTRLDSGDDTASAGAIYVAVGLPYAAAFDGANRLLLWNLITLGLVTAFVLIAAWVGGHFFIVRRVHRLVKATRRLRAGDLATRTGLAHGPGELGLLAEAFDDMAETLQARQVEMDRAAAEIQALNAGLERRVSDRTSQLLAAKEVVEQERGTLAAIMGSMSEGLIVLDATGRVRYSNARVGELLEVDTSGIVGQTTQEIFRVMSPAFQQPEAVRVAWRKALTRLDERPSFELCIAGPPPRDLLLQLFPVVDTRNPGDGVGVVLRDVTLERDLARAKDELVSVVSHELRTPLASLVGFAELLLDRDYAEPQRRQYLTVMLQEGRRLTSLINDFLDLQRMESGRQTVAPVPTDLRTLLTQAVDAAGDDPERPIVLDVDDTLPLALADPGRIQQVVANLLSNARKYSPGGGTVQVSARMENGSVVVAVRDHGLGIPKDALPCLFEKFYRVDNSDRRAIKGTGLGLAVVKQLVEAHGGRAWAESDGPGEGSRFVFTLPCAAESALRGDVLVVEDDPGFARLLEAELAAHDYSTVRVPSGEAALAQLAAAQPRVVLLDLMLPGMQGEAFLRRLRMVGDTEVPVVVVTVKDLDDAARAALIAQGVTAILTKGPGIAVAVQQAVARALAGAEAVPA